VPRAIVVVLVGQWMWRGKKIARVQDEASTDGFVKRHPPRVKRKER